MIDTQILYDSLVRRHGWLSMLPANVLFAMWLMQHETPKNYFDEKSMVIFMLLYARFVIVYPDPSSHTSLIYTQVSGENAAYRALPIARNVVARTMFFRNVFINITALISLVAMFTFMIIANGHPALPDLGKVVQIIGINALNLAVIAWICALDAAYRRPVRYNKQGLVAFLARYRKTFRLPSVLSTVLYVVFLVVFFSIFKVNDLITRSLVAAYFIFLAELAAILTIWYSVPYQHSPINRAAPEVAQ